MGLGDILLFVQLIVLLVGGVSAVAAMRVHMRVLAEKLAEVLIELRHIHQLTDEHERRLTRLEWDRSLTATQQRPAP